MPVKPASAPSDFGRVGFIGLGDMGSPMAYNLVAAGFDVTVFDLRTAALQEARGKGARIAESLASMPQSCRTVGICVWSDDQVNDAVLGPQGLIAGDAKAFTLVVHSTVRPQTIDRIAAAFAPKGWEVVDAPVSGGRAASLTGTLSLMVGAPNATYKRLLPYLDTVGAHVFHVGEKAGMGEVAKLCNNLMGLCNTFAVVEAMKLGASYGLDEDMIRKVAAVSTGMSWYTQHWEFADNLIKTHPQRDVLYKDLWEAVYAAKQKDLQLVLTGVVALSAPRLVDERRALLEKRPQKDALQIGASDDSETIVTAVLQAWSAAASTWDPAGIAANYAEDAVFFGGRPGMQQGRAGVLGYFDSYASVIARAKLTLRDHQVFRLSPDVILAQGFGQFELGFKDGRSSEFTQRGTLTLVRREGRWQILQHHFSEKPAAPQLE